MAGLYPYQKQLLKSAYGGISSLQVIASGRQTGKSYLSKNWKTLYDIFSSMRPEFVKISWRELPGNKLQAYVDPEGTTSVWGLRETDMDPIQQWSMECNCGVRLSFDMWHFKSRKHMTMFLLKWTS